MTGREVPRGPARRVRRRPWTEVPFAALDFETTGLDASRDAVVSFGVVPVERGRVILSGCRYREVAPPVPPSPGSVVVHRLRAPDLAAAPPLREVRSELAEALDGRVLLAWSRGVEAAFLASTFGGSARRWSRRVVDVMLLAARVAHQDGDPRPDLRLEAMARRFRVPVETAHHALGDALMTAELFLVVATKLSGDRPVTVRDLHRIARSGPSYPSRTGRMTPPR